MRSRPAHPPGGIFLGIHIQFLFSHFCLNGTRIPSFGTFMNLASGF